MYRLRRFSRISGSARLFVVARPAGLLGDRSANCASMQLGGGEACPSSDGRA
jgi:hypothetical protein